MGYYTQFAVKCKMNPDAPRSFRDALRDMIYYREKWFDDKSDAIDAEAVRCHEAAEFFDTPRNKFIGIAGPWSYDGHELSIGTSPDGVKNYDGILEKFWAWISPWVIDAPGTVVGGCVGDDYRSPSPVIVGKLDFNLGEDKDVY